MGGEAGTSGDECRCLTEDASAPTVAMISVYGRASRRVGRRDDQVERRTALAPGRVGSRHVGDTMNTLISRRNPIRQAGTSRKQHLAAVIGSRSSIGPV